MDTHLLQARLQLSPTHQLHLTRHLQAHHLSSHLTTHLFTQDTPHPMHRHLTVLLDLDSLKGHHLFRLQVSLVRREAMVRLLLDLPCFLPRRVGIQRLLDRLLRFRHTVGHLSSPSNSILKNTLVNLTSLPMADGKL